MSESPGITELIETVRVETPLDAAELLVKRPRTRSSSSSHVCPASRPQRSPPIRWRAPQIGCAALQTALAAPANVPRRVRPIPCCTGARGKTGAPSIQCSKAEGIVMFYTGLPELQAIERQNLQLRSATFAAAFRLLTRTARRTAQWPQGLMRHGRLQSSPDSSPIREARARRWRAGDGQRGTLPAGLCASERRPGKAAFAANGRSPLQERQRSPGRRSEAPYGAAQRARSRRCAA